MCPLVGHRRILNLLRWFIFGNSYPDNDQSPTIQRFVGLFCGFENLARNQVNVIITLNALRLAVNKIFLTILVETNYDEEIRIFFIDSNTFWHLDSICCQ